MYTSIQRHDEIPCIWLETPVFLTKHMTFLHGAGSYNTNNDPSRNKTVYIYTSIQPHGEISCDWLETTVFLTKHMRFLHVAGSYSINNDRILINHNAIYI